MSRAQAPSLTPEARARLRSLEAKATPGPWYRGHNPDHCEPVAYFREAYAYGPPGRVHLVCVPFNDKPLNDEALFTAITGNGPTSEANAALIAEARNLLPALLDALDAAERERDVAQRALQLATTHTSGDVLALRDVERDRDAAIARAERYAVALRRILSESEDNIAAAVAYNALEPSELVDAAPKGKNDA